MGTTWGICTRRGRNGLDVSPPRLKHPTPCPQLPLPLLRPTVSVRSAPPSRSPPYPTTRPHVPLMAFKSAPLVAPGHTRPVTHLSFSGLQDDGTFLLISSCKDGNPMLREWTGDWIGTFFGHKGAVWSSKLSPDTSRAASGSADFTACVLSRLCIPHWTHKLTRGFHGARSAKSGTPTAATVCILSRTTTSSGASRSRPRRTICLPEARRRKCACSISVDQTPNPSSLSTPPALHPMTVRSRV